MILNSENRIPSFYGKIVFKAMELQTQKPAEKRETEFLEGDMRELLFPANIEPSQLIEMMKVLGKQSSGMELPELERDLHVGTDELTCLINASQILGFTKIHDGCIYPGQRGNRLNDLPEAEKKQLLRERLSLVEPFCSTLAMVRIRKFLLSDEVSNLLYKKDLRWSDDEELNQLLVHDILVEWSIFTGLLRYDGKNDRFSLPP
jgi:hypothetical protein